MSRILDVTLLPGLFVSRETEAALRHLVGLVAKWTPRINLVSAQGLSNIWARHVLDSAQLFMLAPRGPVRWVDLGSGGGFPGLVLNLLALDRADSTTFTFVESDKRKAAFLQVAAGELGLKPTILTTRIEDTTSLHADILSARALGPLTALLGHADRHLVKSGFALFPKGRTANAEVELAKQKWSFDLAISPSMTDPDAQILRIENISHV